MFIYSKNYGGGSISVGIVPAPIDDRLHGHDLAEISMSHFNMNNPESGRKWVAALESATHDQLDAARLQIGFLAKNLERSMFDRFLNFHYTGDDKNRALIRTDLAGEDAADIAQRLFDACLADASETLKRLERNPKNVGIAKELQSTIEFLLEGREFFHVLRTARMTEKDAARALRNEDKVYAFKKRVMDVKAGLGSNYELAAAAILPLDETEKSVKAILDATGSAAPARLPRREIDELYGMVGDYDALWAWGYTATKRAEAVEKGYIRDFTPEELESLRAKAIEVIGINTDTFGRMGFVATLRQVAACAHDRADARTADAISNLEGQARNLKKGLYDDANTHALRISQALKSVPIERARARKEAERNRKIAVTLDDMLESVDIVLRPDVIRYTTVSFTEQDGTWFGRVGGTDDVLVVYRDPNVGNGAPGYDQCVFAVLMTEDQVADLPTLDTVKCGDWQSHDARRLGTNYMSIHEVFSDIARERDASFFFSQPIRVSMAPPAPEDEPAAAPSF